MESNRNKAKKIAKDLRQFAKRFFEDFYTREAKAGRHPLPLEALDAFSRMFTVTEYHELPEPPPDRQLPADAFEDLLNFNLFQQIYLAACDAYGRHTPGLDFKKGKPGRPKTSAKEIERLVKLHFSGQSYRSLAKKELKAQPEGEAKNLLIGKESERIRAAIRRRIPRTK
jgi:hypothetical protein